MRFTKLVLILVMGVLDGCANPLNRATSDNYAHDCASAEHNGHLDVAEEACYRALVNVDWGNLGPELKSQRLYNLGRIKRQLGKFTEAEKLFKASIEIESNLSQVSSLKIGRRHVELAVSLAGQGKWNEGTKHLDNAIPSIPEFSEKERLYVTDVLQNFSKKLQELGQNHMAHHFKRTAEAINDET